MLHIINLLTAFTLIRTNIIKPTGIGHGWKEGKKGGEKSKSVRKGGLVEVGRNGVVIGQGRMGTEARIRKAGDKKEGHRTVKSKLPLRYAKDPR